MGLAVPDNHADPLVSIVLPTYNRSQHLVEAVENCLGQTYTNWELIIVDDGSTDATPQILAELAASHPRLRVVTHPVNRKLPASLNTGFAHARGDLFTWTSDDNYYAPDALREMVAVLTTHQEVALVYADYSEIDEHGAIVRVVSVADCVPNLLYKNCVGPCFLYRRAVQTALQGYAEDLFLAEDYDFWLRASVQFKLFPLHTNLYRYRRHASSLTDSAALAQRWQAREQAILRSLNAVPWATRTTRARAYQHLAGLSYDRKDLRDTASYLWHGYLNNPVFMLRRLLANGVRHTLGAPAADRLRRIYVKVNRYLRDHMRLLTT